MSKSKAIEEKSNLKDSLNFLHKFKTKKKKKSKSKKKKTFEITYNYSRFDEINENTARPRGTLPYGTLTLMGHCFEKGPKILRYTVLHCFL